MGSIDKACISGFLCRLCSEMHRIVIHIYGDQGQRLCLVEKINGYLPITISPNDPLPKTICTTCLRRVEQHYDLLMRLSRIKEERFLRVNNKRPRVSPISSIENSEDEVYQSEDESRRPQQNQDISLRRTNVYASTPTTSTSVSAVSSLTTTEVEGLNLLSAPQSDNNVDHDNGDNSEASTSANALAAITESVAALNDSSTSISSSIHTHSVEGDNSFGTTLQQHSD